MPQRFICGGCGKVIYYSEDVKPPDEIIEMNHGKCPFCNRELSYSPIKVEVKVAEE